MQIKKMVSMISRTGRDLQRYNVQGHRQVVGCIPYRYKKAYKLPSVHGAPVDDLEFLLVSSQKCSRLMFPKGGWEQDESLEEAACRETFEEAGVLGEAENCLGTWCFKSKNSDTLHEGFMLPFFVTEELDNWPERDARLRSWVSYNEAMEQCFHPWMKEALDVFVSQLTLQQRDEKDMKNDMETEETSDEEEASMFEEPRTGVVSQTMQTKDEKSLGAVYCIEVVDQTIGSVYQDMQLLEVKEKQLNALLIEITVGYLAEHLQRKEGLQDSSLWGYSNRKKDWGLEVKEL